MFRKKLKTVFFCLLLCLCLSCSLNDPMPTKDKVQSYFDDNREDILCLNEHITHSEFHFIGFTNYGSKRTDDIEVYADYRYDIVLPDDVNAALHRLGDRKKLYIYYSEDTMTVEYEIWYDSHDRGCGFAFVMDDRTEPDILYLLSSEPLTEEDWYYFVTDYNATR